VGLRKQVAHRKTVHVPANDVKMTLEGATSRLPNKPRQDFCKRGHDLSQTREFRKDGTSKGCGDCHRQTCLDWHNLHSEEARARLKVSYQSNPKTFWQRNLKNKYGITVTEYERMLADQDGVCAICKGPESRAGFQLGVDHNHETGAVRGLLCTKCNTAIGLLNDNQDLVETLLAYLKRYESALSFPSQLIEKESKNGA
jgi:hypothetical protein